MRMTTILKVEKEKWSKGKGRILIKWSQVNRVDKRFKLIAIEKKKKRKNGGKKW